MIKLILIVFYNYILVTSLLSQNIDTKTPYILANKNYIEVKLKYKNYISADDLKNEIVIRIKNASTNIGGKFILKKDIIIFKPFYTFDKNIDYEIIFSDKILKTLLNQKKKLNFRFNTPDIEKKTDILNIYPTKNVLPENILRFYIKFSQPIKEGNFLNYIKLEKINGDKVVPLEKVFFDNQYELWNQNHTVLTIIVDPGRVKSGLKKNIELGRAFEPNNKYKLTIKKNWNDIYGNQLKNNFSKTFSVSKADLTPPDLKKWEISPPILLKNKDKTLPLLINFNDTLDHFLISQMIAIKKKNESNIIKGKIEPIHDDTSMKFIPEKNWEKGEYEILINSRLEDLAGNNINGLFDHKIGSLINSKEGIIKKILFQIK